MKKLILAGAVVILSVLGATWLYAGPQYPRPATPSYPPAKAPPGLAATATPTSSTALAQPSLLAVATPNVGTPSATPPTIVVNMPTTVTVTVLITPSPLLNGVNLLRLGATGTQPTILGVMHDDGKNGDTVAGDGIYTLRFPFSEPTAGQIQLQASVAFQGLLKRITSTVSSVAVWTSIVPTNSPVSFSFAIPPHWTITQQPSLINIYPPNTALDPSQEYAGDYLVFIDANPNGLSLQAYYNGTSGPDLYGDASSINNFTVSGHTAVRYAQTTGIDGVDTVVIVLPDHFLRIEDRGDSTTFDQIVQTFLAP